MKYRKKPVIVDAITFDEFIQYGIDHGAEIVDGLPLRFEYKGHMVTRGNEYCYVIPTMEGDHVFTADDMLITGVQGEIYPCKRFIFDQTYEVVSNADDKDISSGLISKLEADLLSVQSERDQLLKDIKFIVDITNACCWLCKYDEEDGIPEPCKDCGEEDDHWTWRGVPDLSE